MDLLSYYQEIKGTLMEFLGIVIFVVLGVLINNFKRKLRRDYYRNDYLKSDSMSNIFGGFKVTL